MNTGIAFWKQKGRPASNGGVAQLGEHLPCKQGVKSSNLSISIRNLMIKFRDTYLENRILNRNELIIQLNIKTSEAMWSSDWSYGKQYNKFCKQPRPKDATLCIWDEKATRASTSGHFEAEASQCHLLRKCHEIRKNVLMKVNFQRPFSQISAAFKSIWSS